MARPPKSTEPAKSSLGNIVGARLHHFLAFAMRRFWWPPSDYQGDVERREWWSEACWRHPRAKAAPPKESPSDERLEAALDVLLAVDRALQGGDDDWATVRALGDELRGHELAQRAVVIAECSKAIYGVLHARPANEAATMEATMLIARLRKTRAAFADLRIEWVAERLPKYTAIPEQGKRGPSACARDLAQRCKAFAGDPSEWNRAAKEAAAVTAFADLGG